MAVTLKRTGPHSIDKRPSLLQAYNGRYSRRRDSQGESATRKAKDSYATDIYATLIGKSAS